MSNFSYPQNILQDVSSATSVAELTYLHEYLKSTANSTDDSLLAYIFVQWRLHLFEECLASILLHLPQLSHNPLLWTLKGMVHKSLHQPADAISAYRKALSLAPNRADIYYNLGNLERSDPKKAIQLYNRSLALDAYQSYCWHNIGSLYLQQYDFRNARTCLVNSILLDPYASNVWCDIGNFYQSTSNYPAAIASFTHALSLDPSHSQSEINLGASLLSSGDAIRSIRLLESNSATPHSYDALWNLSLAYLTLGDFTSGWTLYDSRLSLPSFPLDRPPTNGPLVSSLKQLQDTNSPLAILTEQGIGDTIQFIRYLPLLSSLGVDFILITCSKTIELIKYWTPYGRLTLDKADSPFFDDHRPYVHLLSLPKLFQTTIDTIPSTLPNLSPLQPTPQHLHVKQPPGGLSIGIVWASEPSNRAMYRVKSTHVSTILDPLLPLLKHDLADVHSLQYGDDGGQLSEYSDFDRIYDWSPLLTNFSDTAHILSQLDLVISVDTAVAHLSASLNKPTWLLLPYAADFRWLQHCDSSPWYPSSLRIFRQTKAHDWSSVRQQLEQALSALTLLKLEQLP